MPTLTIQATFLPSTQVAASPTKCCENITSMTTAAMINMINRKRVDTGPTSTCPALSHDVD
eukprot:5019088-Amphidinium_carterae.1